VFKGIRHEILEINIFINIVIDYYLVNNLFFSSNLKYCNFKPKSALIFTNYIVHLSKY